MSGKRIAVVVVSGVSTFVMLLFCFVVVLQPWRSCPEIDDSSASCPVLERDAVLLQLGGVGLVLAVAVLVIALTRRPASSRSEPVS